MTAPRRVLVACMGNVLRGDDGFGVAVARELAIRDLPPDVTVIEVGIGGIHLVQELLTGYQALVIVDAVDRGAEPGSVFLLEPRVPALDPLPERERSALLADTHYAVPSRVLVMAKALGVLPSRAWILGCQPEDGESLSLDLSEAVGDAVPEAVERLERLWEELGLNGTGRPTGRPEPTPRRAPGPGAAS